MSYLQRASTAAPSTLLRDPEFWQASRSLPLTVGAGVALIAALYPLTYSRLDDPTIGLTVLIHLLVFWGASTALRGLARIEVDDAIARQVEQRVTAELARIKGGLKDRVRLDRVAIDFLPYNPSHDKGMLRLFQHILEEARDRKFHPNAVVIQPFREEGLGVLLRVQTIQRLALQLGILGTFAGLILALSQLSADGRALLEPRVLQQLFDALYVSFSTSVAGLQVAIILGLVVLIVRRRQEAFFKNMESASAALIALARNSINPDDFLVEFEQVRTAVTQTGERVREQSRETEAQTETIRGGLSRLAEVQNEFGTLLGRIRQDQALVLEEMKTVYEVISPRQVAAELRESLSATNRELLQDFREDLTRSLSEIGKLNSSLLLVNSVGTTMKEQTEKQSQGLEESRAAFQRSISDLSQVLERATRLQADLLDRITTPAPAVASPGTVGAPAQKIPDGQIERHLERVARQLDGLCAQLDRNHSAIRDLVSAHQFYRSLICKPRDWWESLQGLCARLTARLRAS